MRGRYAGGGLYAAEAPSSQATTTGTPRGMPFGLRPNEDLDVAIQEFPEADLDFLGFSDPGSVPWRAACSAIEGKSVTLEMSRRLTSGRNGPPSSLPEAR